MTRAPAVPRVSGPVPGTTGGARRARWWLRGLASLVFAAGAVALLGDRRPDLGELLGTLRSADPKWLVAAVVAEAVSMAMFACQQRRLLRAFGVGMTMRRAAAITYAGSAMSTTLPAGAAVSAAFAFRQFRVQGATRSVAATVMILSGLASATGLALLYLLGAGTLAATLTGGLIGPATIAVVVTCCGLLARLAVRSDELRKQWTAVAAALGPGSDVHIDAAAPTHRSPLTQPKISAPALRSRVARLHPVAEALTAAAAVAPRHWFTVLAFATINWLADLVCLLCVAQAFGLTSSVVQIGAVYLGVQIVRQLPLTPGGIGLIEASLLAGLIAAGAVPTTAAAVVLGYRVFSFWLILPIGFATWAGLHHPVSDGTIAELPRWWMTAFGRLS